MALSGKRRCLTLIGEEFVRRVLLHVLPKGLMRIRHFGLLANRSRREKLAQVREALEDASEVLGTRKNAAQATCSWYERR